MYYADNLIIITATRTDGQIIKIIIQKELVAVGLTLNDGKEITNDDIESIECLGAKITGNLTWDAEVKQRVDMAAKSIKASKDCVIPHQYNSHPNQ